jgi:ribonucleotide monophosphatase NagD (HAD superfamily)
MLIPSKTAEKLGVKKVKGAKDATMKKETEDKTLVYDSLQVAHTYIFNSCYGYVTREGTRWCSILEMPVFGAGMIVQLLR